jgi:hypothetical protein
MRRHPRTTDEPTPGEVLDRRALLRRAGTVAAIAGGAAVVQAAGGGTASAAAGGPAILGANDAGTNTTAITSAATSGATLALDNTGTTNAALSLADCQPGYSTLLTKTTGELYADGGDLFWVDKIGKAGAFVFTETTANQVVGITPKRMLDTRTAPGRLNIVLPATGPSPLDSAGRLIGLRWLNVDLSSLADFFESAFVNLTAVSPTAPGYLTISPAPALNNGAPATSSLNYGLANLANAAVVPSIDGTVWIYTLRTTHVILDVTALNLPGSNHLLAASPASAAVKSNAERRVAFAKSRAAAALRG